MSKELQIGEIYCVEFIPDSENEGIIFAEIKFESTTRSVKIIGPSKVCEPNPLKQLEIRCEEGQWSGVVTQGSESPGLKCIKNCICKEDCEIINQLYKLEVTGNYGLPKEGEVSYIYIY